MLRKILTYLLRGLFVLFGLLLLISVAVYLPGVQRWGIEQAASYVQRHLHMELQIERFRLTFPLRLRIDHTLLKTAAGDTLLQSGSMAAEVALWPLLRGEVRVVEFALEETRVDYRDTLSSLALRADIGALVVRGVQARWKEQSAAIRRIDLEESEVDFTPGSTATPDTTTADTATLAWTIRLAALNLQEVRFHMPPVAGSADLKVQLPEGTVREVDVDLGRQQVAVQSLRLVDGDYQYLTGQTSTLPPASTQSTSPVTSVTSGTVPAPSSASRSAAGGTSPTEPAADSTDQAAAETPPWNISLQQLELLDNRLAYGVATGTPAPGFDPSHLRIQALNLQIDSLRNRGTAIAAVLRSLSFEERSELAVQSAQGRFVLDSAGISLTDFALKTPESQVTLQAQAGNGLLSMHPDTPLSLAWEAQLAPADLWIFYPAPVSVRHAFRGRMLTFDGQLNGRLDRIDLQSLSLRLSRAISLRLDGQLRSVTDPRHLGGSVRWYGRLSQIDFLKALLPDTTLQHRLAFPKQMTLRGHMGLSGQTYTPSLQLEVDTARLTLEGKLNLRDQRYRVDLTALQFPLNEFLPQDSLGELSLQLQARGQGFDPTAEGTTAALDLQIEHFDYNHYRYHDLGVQATVAEHRLQGRLYSRDDALSLDLALHGELTPETYAAQLKGPIAQLDLQALHFVSDPLHGSLYLETDLWAQPDSAAYRAEVIVDSVRITHGFFTDAIRRTALEASADRRQVSAEIRSGDLTARLQAFLPLDSLSGSLQRTAACVARQLDSSDLNMALLQEALPPFRLTASAGQQNLLYNFLQAQRMGFEQLTADIATDSTAPFHGSVVINGWQAAGMVLDTLNIGLKRNDRRLDYYLRLANRPGNLEQMALIALYGDVEGKTARINFFQRDRSDSIGFWFGFETLLQDSSLRISLFPLNPIFGYAHWQVNPDNYLLLQRDKKLYADLKLEHGRQYVRLQPGRLPHLSDGVVSLDVAGIDLASVLELLPAPPPIEGLLATHLTLGLNQKTVAAQGQLQIDTLQYAGQRVGDIGLQLSFLSDSLQHRKLDARLDIDRETVLTARGSYVGAPQDSLHFTLGLPAFPLVSLNPFLPEQVARLAGTLRGEVLVEGPLHQPAFEGSLRMADGQLTVPMIGTSFGLSDRPITFADHHLTFDSFGLTAPGNKILALNGTVDLSDFSQLSTDLRVKASDFPLINAPRTNKSMVYGKANADIDLSARGKLNMLTLRGNVRLLGSTDVAYTLQDSPLEISDQEQHIVTFVSFNDTTAMARLDSVPPVSVWGMDMLVNVNIDNNVKATVNLSDDGNNRIALIGEGSLTYTMNPQGDARFTGRYVLSGGTVVYNPPIISQKVFSIDNKSYVEWTGDIGDPSFNITATESVQTTVTTEDNSSRKVTFDITVNVRNTLKDLAITFDLAAPGDITIQNQLLSLAPEQRSTQAMALLIYNTYTGPGTTAKIDSNNPLNSFIEKELNQWARNNLKNVDVSFGIQSVTDPSSSSGQHTDYSYRVSKNLFNDRVKVTIGGSVSSNVDPTQNMKENFVDDISLEYRLDKRDNMSLKVYRYNTQESILEGEVIDTGVGFVVRKKLNRLGNLFRLTRDPEKRQQREERRARRKQARQAARNASAPSSEDSTEDISSETAAKNPTADLSSENASEAPVAGFPSTSPAVTPAEVSSMENASAMPAGASSTGTSVPPASAPTKKTLEPIESTRPTEPIESTETPSGHE